MSVYWLASKQHRGLAPTLQQALFLADSRHTQTWLKIIYLYLLLARGRRKANIVTHPVVHRRPRI